MWPSGNDHTKVRLYGAVASLTGRTHDPWKVCLPRFMDHRRSLLYRKRSPGVPSYAAGRMPCSMSAGVGSKDGAGCPQSAASQAAVT